MKIILIVLISIAIFWNAQRMAKKDGKSIWRDTAGERGLRDLFLDEGDEYLLKSFFFLGVPLAMLWGAYKAFFS